MDFSPTDPLAEASETCPRPPEVIVGDVRARLEDAFAHPGAQTEPLVRACLAELRSLPNEWRAPELAEALLGISRFYYMAASAASGLEPSRMAVEVARALGDKSLERKAQTFRGALLTDTGNMPEATQCFAEALQLAQALNDPVAEATVWNLLGLLLLHASLHTEAVPCFDRATLLSEGRPELASVRAAALINGALAALHQKDYAKSYQRCIQALASCGEPTTPDKQFERAVIEGIFVRVLLSLEDVGRAQEHAKLARDFAHASGLARAEIAAETASGLTEIAGNAKDVGLTRIKRMVELARSKVRATLVDTLATAVTAYERAGEPDVALVHLHELLALNKDAKASQVLLHHGHYVDQLDRSGAGDADAVDHGLIHQQDQLRDQLKESREQVRRRSLQVEQQALAAERLDDQTGEHCFRVGRLASILGREIGLEDDVCFLIDLAARLHDIGKLIVPDAILLKPGKLTLGERSIMETHTTAGWEILGKTNIPQMHIAQQIARHHHEKWDGSGYPDKLHSTAIPIAARVSALADVFDALTHVRPYKDAWPVDRALATIRELSGIQFDPELTEIFLDLVPRLQREHGDLDRFLAADAKNSPFIKARDRIAAALKGTDPNVSLFDLRR